MRYGLVIYTMVFSIMSSPIQAQEVTPAATKISFAFRLDDDIPGVKTIFWGRHITEGPPRRLLAAKSLLVNHENFGIADMVVEVQFLDETRATLWSDAKSSTVVFDGISFGSRVAVCSSKGNVELKSEAISDDRFRLRPLSVLQDPIEFDLASGEIHCIHGEDLAPRFSILESLVNPWAQALVFKSMSPCVTVSDENGLADIGGLAKDAQYRVLFFHPSNPALEMKGIIHEDSNELPMFLGDRLKTPLTDGAVVGVTFTQDSFQIRQGIYQKAK